MTESLNGLRFDIYERVHLPEEVADIAELEEIELVPHMQAIPLDDHVLLKGHLLLTGSYRSLEERAEPSRLEHWIPVEISLPPSRVERLEDLSVEIDNFDVDLLSSRSLNVTGVLGLRGLQLAAQQAPVWRENEFTVVHQAPTSAAPFEQQDAERRWNAPPSGYPGLQGQPADEFESPHQAFEPAEEQRAEGESPFAAPQSEAASAPYRPPEPEAVQESPPAEQRQPDRTEINLLNADYGEEGWGDVTVERIGAEREPAQAPAPAPAASPAPAPALERQDDAPPEKAEPKVAFAAKQAADPSPASAPEFGVGLLSQLGDKGSRREADLRTAEAEARAAQEEQEALAALSGESTGDEVEWTRLFLSRESAEQSFRKVKLCIVQREDTLEAIATRYNVQSRELQLYNGLNDPNVSEGQVIYIP